MIFNNAPQSNGVFQNDNIKNVYVPFFFVRNGHEKGNYLGYLWNNFLWFKFDDVRR